MPKKRHCYAEAQCNLLICELVKAAAVPNAIQMLIVSPQLSRECSSKLEIRSLKKPRQAIDE
jgi:hypothetical protein